MPIPAGFANFDIAGSGVSVWLFKKSGGTGGAHPTFTGRWIATDADLDAALKAAVIEARGEIEEVQPYSLLAQNNEASALTIETVETHAGLIVDKAANALPQHKVKTLKQVQNTSFYVVKFTSGGQVLHCVRKTDASWRSTRRRNAITALFQNETLGLEESPGFSLSKYVDFYILDDQILVVSKRDFESVLSYKQAHQDDFQALQAEPEFLALFTDLAPLVAFVGANKIQLRRACAIHQKGHYRDIQFMQRLRQQHAQYGLALEFDAAGLLNPTQETCSDIITALLDHRLMSAFSGTIYDVPDATAVV